MSDNSWTHRFGMHRPKRPRERSGILREEVAMKNLTAFLCTITSVTLLPACHTTDPASAASSAGSAGYSDAARLFADYHEARLKLYPLEATMAGDDRYNDRLPNNLTDEFRAAESAFYKKYLAALGRLDRARLSQEDQLSCAILQWECETQLEQLRFPAHLMPLNQFHSLHLDIGQWAAGRSAQPFKTVRDYENWLKRLDAFTEWCRTAVKNMRAGMKRGHVLPGALTQKTIPQMAALARGPVEDHLYYSPIKLMPAEFSDADRARLARAYSAAVEKRVIPAFRKLEGFLTEEYLSASRSSSGIDAIPNGPEYYRSQIKAFTTTDFTAEEIHQLGRREVRRLLGEMNQVREAVGFQGDMKAFFEHVRTRPELMPFADPQHVVANFHAIHRRMQPSLQRLFSLAPKTPFEIRRTESFREASASAEWTYGSLDGARPGIFYVPIPNVKEYNVGQDEALFLHEAIPGHHYQLSLQRENQSLPMFRRVFDASVFSEGWALYCESLGKELGLYTDPYQYFGMLSMEMHRAIRLVVDTGLHAKGWTREQAIEYSLDHEAESEAGIVAEIERYMSWPGQALSYKVGQLKIRELRARAETALGARFDIREFHTKVLESGAMPLKLLEQKIDRWIAERRTRADERGRPASNG
jgi:uncharacterized protein (DUF885 family)